MPMFRVSGADLVMVRGLILLLTLGVLAAESFTILGFAHGLLYLPIILITVLVGDVVLLTLVFVVSIVSVWTGYLISPPPPEELPAQYVYGNRLLSIAALAALYLTSLFFLRYRQSSEAEISRKAHNATRLLDQWHQAMESITDAFLTIDNDYRLTYLNPRAESIIGRSSGTLKGRLIWQVFELGQDSIFFAEVSAAMNTATARTFTAFFSPTNMWLDVRVYPSSGGLAICFRDVTQEKKEQEELILLRSAISKLNDIILITKAEPIDAPGPEIVFVNDAFERITGYSTSEVIGKTPRILQGKGTERGELDRIRHSLAQWKPVRAQLLNYKKNGDELWLEIDIAPVADESGWYTHWVSVERDITEQKLLQEHIEASHRLESLGQLTGGIAHEFNNLLTVIKGNAELIAEASPESERSFKRAGLIKKAANRGATLTRSLLAFSRRQALSPEIVDIRSLLHEMSPIVAAGLGSRITLTTNIEENAWNVLVDSAQLEDALLNLFINAAEAMPTGGSLAFSVRNVRIDENGDPKYSTLKPGRYLAFVVTDTGAGIPAERLDKVFNPFFSTKPAGEGSGLGLSKVFGFVQQSAGHISVESKVGSGTTFELLLPATEGAEHGNSSQRMERHQDAGMIEVGSVGKVLVVEDDDDIRSLAVGYLTEHGFNTLEAQDAQTAIDIIDTADDIALLFTDVVLSGFGSGLDVARHLEQHKPDVPIVYTSGFSSTLHDQSLSKDVVLLPKPYDSDILVRVIERAIYKRSGAAKPE